MPTDLVARFHVLLSVNHFVNISAAISAEVVYSQFIMVSDTCPVIISCSVAIEILWVRWRYLMVGFLPVSITRIIV